MIYRLWITKDRCECMVWESKQKILFSWHKQLKTKVENMHWCCIRMSKNDSMCHTLTFYSKVAKLLIAPRNNKVNITVNNKTPTQLLTNWPFFLSQHTHQTNSVKALTPTRRITHQTSSFFTNDWSTSNGRNYSMWYNLYFGCPMPISRLTGVPIWQLVQYSMRT